MSWQLIAGRRRFVALVALGSTVAGLSTVGLAQDLYRPKDEIFGGYSILIPNGWGDLFYKVNTIPNAFDASNTYYFRNAANFGILFDGSGHFKGSTTPPNLDNGSNDSSAVGYGLGGLQYKWHNNKLSPFLRGFLGAANISPDCCHGTQWSFAAGGGGGLDLGVKPRFSIRLIQADYIYSHYSHVVQETQVSTQSNQLAPITHPTQWNSVRLAAGIVFNFGSYSSLPVSCAVTATPTQIFAGEPIKVSTTGTNFNPKHAVAYGWTTNGGKVSNGASQAAEIDTTGLAPGSYSVSSTITDSKAKSASATCAAGFIAKPPPPPPPPVVSCSISPASLAVGESAVVTMLASSPDQRPLTYKWSADGGQLSGTGTSATLTTYPADGGKTITVTATATDDRSLSMSSTCSVDVKAPLTPPCVHIEPSRDQCTFDKDPKRPWRVDNDCKDVLDNVATRLQQHTNETLVIVGYTDSTEASKDPTLGARRAVNAKYYLTKDSSTRIDPSRIQPRQDGTKGMLTEFYFVPEGKICVGEPDKLGTLVDESKMQGQPRAPAGAKKPVKAKATAAPSQ